MYDFSNFVCIHNVAVFFEQITYYNQISAERRRGKEGT